MNEITLHYWYAGMALTGLIGIAYQGQGSTMRETITRAHNYAKEMLAERNRRGILDNETQRALDSIKGTL